MLGLVVVATGALGPGAVVLVALVVPVGAAVAAAGRAAGRSSGRQNRSRSTVFSLSHSRSSGVFCFGSLSFLLLLFLWRTV